MNNRLLGIVIFISVVLIFWGNNSVARTECEFQGTDCWNCKCKTLITIKDPDMKKEPSCSVVFNTSRPRISLAISDQLSSLNGKEISYGGAIPECGFTLYCDPGASADLKCEGLNKTNNGFLGLTKWEEETYQTNIWGNQKCGAVCERKSDRLGINVTCNHWERKAAKKPGKKPPVTKPSTKKPAVKRPGLGGLSAFLFAPTDKMLFPLSSFAPVVESNAQPTDNSDDPATNSQDDGFESIGIINDSVRWKPIDGEAGLENGVLMVSEGKAEAQSFCTGDTTIFEAPMMVSMPTCPANASGHWEGAFARPRPKGAPPETPRSVVPMILNLRQAGGSLTGELKTADGTFTVRGSQNGANIGIEATRAGSKAKIDLHGSLTRQSIIFGGSEQSAEGVGTYRLVGYFKRLYIADDELPTAVLNTPYNFRLTAFAPGGQEFTFRLATPAANGARTKMSATANPLAPAGQKEINWFTQAENLRGRNGERFTFLCPANGTLNGYLYGTDAYSDSSSICKAAVHAGLIKLQTGGAVTIEIGPNAAAYPATTRNGVLSSTYSYGTGKGSFVFAKGDSPKAAVETPKVAERGRLPQGISFDSSTGTFSGTPTETGSFDLVVVAEDGTGNLYEQPLTINVRKMAVINGLLHDGFVGQPYSAVLNVAGGTAPYRFSASLPRGLQINPSTGQISGTPSSTMPFAAFDVTIRDSQNNTETQKVTMSVRGTTIFGSHYLPDASVGAPYRAQFQAVGNPSPVIWKAYPTNIGLIGLVLNEQTGEISGTPTKAGSFLIQMRAEAGGSVSRSFTLTIE